MIDFGQWLSGAPVPPSEGLFFDHWLDGAPVPEEPVEILVIPVVVFVGEIIQVAVRGRVLTARGQSGGSLLDRAVPRFRLQTGCNHTLFDVGCGLAKADWKFTATVSDPGTAGYPFEFALAGVARVTGSAPTFFDQWFAGGWIEFGSGSTWCRRAILRSTTVTGGAVTVTLSRDPEPFPEAGDAVVLFPGCDGRFETCKAYHVSINPTGKFGNPLNFGGHPFVPIGNPSLLKVSEAVAGAKK